MKIILYLHIIFSLAFSQYSVAKFGYTNGDVFILQNGKLVKAFQGLSINSNDTIYVRSYSQAKIIFNNKFEFTIRKKSTIKVADIMDNNKVSQVKTTKELQKERSKSQKQNNDYKYNSKFYKQRFNNLNNLKEYNEKRFIDKKKNIIVHSENENIQNFSSGGDSSVEIGTVNIEPTSGVKNIIIIKKAVNVQSYSKGQGSRSTIDVGQIHVK